jgi:hypothetical protein
MSPPDGQQIEGGLVWNGNRLIMDTRDSDSLLRHLEVFRQR